MDYSSPHTHRTPWRLVRPSVPAGIRPMEFRFANIATQPLHWQWRWDKRQHPAILAVGDFFVRLVLRVMVHGAFLQGQLK